MNNAEFYKIIDKLSRNLMSLCSYQKMEDEETRVIQKFLNEPVTKLFKLFEKKISLLENEKTLLLSKSEEKDSNYSKFFNSFGIENANINELISIGDVSQASKILKSYFHKEITDLTNFLQCQASLVESLQIT